MSDIDIEGPVGEAGHKEGAWEEESANLVDPAEEKLQLDQQSKQNYQESREVLENLLKTIKNQYIETLKNPDKTRINKNL